MKALLVDGNSLKDKSYKNFIKMLIKKSDCFSYESMNGFI